MSLPSNKGHFQRSARLYSSQSIARNNPETLPRRRYTREEEDYILHADVRLKALPVGHLSAHCSPPMLSPEFNVARNSRGRRVFGIIFTCLPRGRLARTRSFRGRRKECAKARARVKCAHASGMLVDENCARDCGTPVSLN